MDGWNKLQSSLSGINFAQAGTKLTKGLSSSVQATRERLGQVAADEITELPQGTSLTRRGLERTRMLMCPKYLRIQRSRSPR